MIFLIGLFSAVGIFLAAAYGLMGPMPALEQLENPKTNLATQIFSSDGEVLGKFYFNENRTPITYKELPQNIIDALIATEDERYRDHAGIDWRGTLRAIYYLGRKGGASTITQQLARQLFVGVRSRNRKEAVVQKIKEWVLSVQLEQRYTKNEIIAMYLNIYDFGYNADGVRSAAKIFFDTSPDALLLEQSATLVGMLKKNLCC
jgi:penicillin-binding protein 1A